MRKQTRGRRRNTKRKTRKLYRQRGGAVVGLGPAIDKLRFVMTFYSDNASITVFLDRLLKVLETSQQIIPRTFPELEAYYLTIPAFDQIRVPGAVGATTFPRKDALRAKMLKYDLSRIPVAPGTPPITIHNDAQNDFGFEQNVNNVITTATQLFDTLVKTVDAAGLPNDAASKREAFLAKFNGVGWVCVDGTASDILEFIENSEFIIITRQSFLLNFGRRMNGLLHEICKEQTYYKLEKASFISSLQNDIDLQRYISKYKNGTDGVREKAVLNVGAGLPDVGEPIHTIIAAIFEYLITADTVAIINIGTTEFVQACVDTEAHQAGAAVAAAAAAGAEAFAAANAVANEQIRAAFVAKLRAKSQRLVNGDIFLNSTIIMKLLQVYNATNVKLHGVDEINLVTITAVTPTHYNYVFNGVAIVEPIHNIEYIEFSYVAPAVAAVPV